MNSIPMLSKQSVRKSNNSHTFRKEKCFLYYWVGKYLWTPREIREKKIIKENEMSEMIDRKRKIERRWWGCPPFWVYK